MMSLIQMLGNFISWIFSSVEQVFLTVTDILTWVTVSLVSVKTIIGTVCPVEIALIVTPVLISMFTFLGIKLLVRLL